MASISTPTVDHGGSTTISAVHPDVIQAHILTRLDGPTLASTSCASSQLHTLSDQDQLWRHICTSTWPSIDQPRLQHLISTFPAGHRSFFSDSFPVLDHLSSPDTSSPDPSSPPTTELISAVDIFYKDTPIFSKIQETQTETGWFLCSPFRVQLLDPKESVPTPIRHVGDDNDDGVWLEHLEENLTLSWIMIDPARKRAANLSSRKPVSVERHWLTGEVQLRYGTIMKALGSGEEVQCAMVVTCGEGEELGGKLQVREVSLVVEDMEGKHLSGKDSLGILENAVEGGKRKKGKEMEGKERFEEYMERKRERRERKARREKLMDLGCIVTGVSMFVCLWSFLVLS
ncbi:hypothetical protein FNV43_RR17716 [Rhamnella rubrinervis]|uniref:F-box domain-containing protein n=1 Tax=Rhamnella rubrinervis TaxID=2594499 RepID=A0A8K0GVX3_9ROSA|nr:hypothetical protein FNV43_RR17716 [Rhamnella rubrinervis]